ncbi:MAG: VWA domain-containing protein [Planctomycetaceae bacterium]|nr:VWA domain-containing protein [Planctomycetaceae bacterium]
MKEWLTRLFPEWPAWGEFWSTFEFGRETKSWWLLGFIGLFLAATWLYRRDTRDLHPFWKVWLWSLRLLTLLALLIVALAPQERKSQITSQYSRVILLVDTSVSMSRQDKDVAAGSAADGSVPSRAELVRRLLEQSPLLDTLRETHDVSVTAFDSQLAKVRLLPKRVPDSTGQPNAEGPAAAGAATAKPGDALSSSPSWAEIVRPRGAETRLGEALLQTIREEAADTLSGVVLITDGGNNAGVDPLAAADAAVAGKVRVIPVGVGSTKKPVTLQLAEIQAPTHVHIGDGFTITAFVSGQGMANKPLKIDLLSKLDQDEGEPIEIQTREEQLLEDGVPITVAFDYSPTAAGRRTFLVRVAPVQKVADLADDVVQDEVGIEVIDRKTRVLLVAGGPMRDYQFVRTLLNRDKTIDVDVLLQTGVPGISQESDNVIFDFPSSREELFNYDVIVAFDPDWRKIAGENGETLKLLSEWVFAQAGGLVLVAGDVFTPQLASADEAVQQELQSLLELYPVVLDKQRLIEDEEFQQPWPVEFTRDGIEAGFLQLTDNTMTSAAAWKEFPGIYRCFPTDGPKAGATVYARFSDPRSAAISDQPILLATQFYGAGRVLYLGSAEWWRLRSLDEDFYDRLWIKLLREVGQGRLLRGTNRGILLLEKTQYALGATIQVRARLLDPQFKDYVADKVAMEIYDPAGKPISPSPVLLADKTRPGHFGGAFLAGLPGSYKLELPIPDSTDQLKGSISVRLPNLEFDHPEQNEPLLRAMARRETGGVYLSLDEAAAKLPQLLPDRTTQKIQYDRPQALWDREWVMYALVGLLSLEWLTRKLLKLA